MRTSDFDYELPPEAIAQHARPRGTSRLLVLDRARSSLRETTVGSLPALLDPGDVLLLNDVRVIPARLRAVRPGGGLVELLLVRPAGGACWEVMARPGKRLRVGMTVRLSEGLAIPRAREADGRWVVEFDPPLDDSRLEAVGEVPLPPYIRREHPPDDSDRKRYQTVYAADGRAVAAPTAGLHFTPELLDAVRARGVETASLTLHVGPGTFKPVSEENPLDHVLDAEDFEIPTATAGTVNAALACGRRVVCVGTTSCRAIEFAARKGGGRISPGPDRADIFIVPPHRFLVTGGLLTNFHLPRSTLLMLVSALAGRSSVLAAYRQAVARGFSFYSFGDAMLVL